MVVADAPALVESAAAWRPATRLAFRFSIVYFGLYVLCTQMLPTLMPGINAFGSLEDRPPVRTIVSWTATHLFRVTRPLVVTGSGSGDKTFDWVEAFCILIAAAATAFIWSAVDRRRAAYPSLFKWFRVFVRFSLGSTMFVYGFDKIVPLQMGYPGPFRLVEPFGNFSPMGVLWSSIGASPAYEICAGAAEILGGVLVMIPQTALLGAIVCLFDVVEIFTLNMTYDVPVKLFSFHLILFALVVLAPDTSRLFDFFIRNRPVNAAADRRVFRSRRAVRIGLTLELLFVAYLAGMNLVSARQAWTRFGGGAPKSPLYGVWNVQRLTLDGTAPPAVGEPTVWRRVLFDQPGTIGVQHMDDTIVHLGASFVAGKPTLLLNKPNDKAWHAEFTYEELARDRLVLDGTMDQQAIHAELRLADPDTFLLRSRGFHWIQEYPFNR
jgi:uncharacterized membrane protein YphA (DoxX/SURF4 family)